MAQATDVIGLIETTSQGAIGIARWGSVQTKQVRRLAAASKQLAHKITTRMAVIANASEHEPPQESK